jgi:RraA family protein
MARAFATADLADVATTRIAMDGRIVALWPGARLAGPAFTVRTPPGEHRAVREAAEHAPAGAVIVVDASGDLEQALWGDKMSKLAQDRGIAGVVVDGAVRDADAIAALGFPVFAAGRTPTPPNRDRMGQLGGAVNCGGVTVHPDDVVYADADGVVVIPADEHEDILSRLEAAS